MQENNNLLNRLPLKQPRQRIHLPQRKANIWYQALALVFLVVVSFVQCSGINTLFFKSYTWRIEISLISVHSPRALTHFHALHTEPILTARIRFNSF